MPPCTSVTHLYPEALHVWGCDGAGGGRQMGRKGLGGGKVGKYSLPGGAAPSTEVHLTPPQRKNYTHPKLHSTPRLHKKQDTQAELLPHLRSGLLKSRDALQRMVTTSPPAEGSTNAPKAPCAWMHPPTTSATHQPGPQPGGGAPQEPRGRLPGR